MNDEQSSFLACSEHLSPVEQGRDAEGQAVVRCPECGRTARRDDAVLEARKDHVSKEIGAAAPLAGEAMEEIAAANRSAAERAPPHWIFASHPVRDDVAAEDGES